MSNSGSSLRKVCILDYGSGNVKSVKHAFERLDVAAVVSNSIEDMQEASHIVLPGVGAFGNAMERIQNSIPLLELEAEVLEKKKPFLGICVGMQVLAEWGNEHGKHPGLGWIRNSEVFENTRQVGQPHIGWNNVSTIYDSPIMNGLKNDTDFYFVHSYIIQLVNEKIVVGVTNYGISFPSVIQSRNIFGVQFHPEKSQSAGLRLLNNFTLIK